MQELVFNKLKNARMLSNSTIFTPRLIRSEALSNLDKDDVKTLKEKYNLKTIIDLRTPREIQKKKDVSIPGTSYHHIPLATVQELGMVRDESFYKLLIKKDFLPNMNMAYKHLFNKDKEPYWRKIFEILLNQTSGTILFHCSAGKDRCGMVAAIIEYCLGFSMEDIMNDYFLTNDHIIFLPMYKVIYRLIPKDFKDDYMKLFYAQKEFFDSGIENLKENYGSISNFLKNGCGLSSESIEKLKKMYISIKK